MNSASLEPTTIAPVTERRLPDSTKISYAQLCVADSGRALRFYRDLLGLVETRTEGGTTSLSTSVTQKPLLLITEDLDAKPKDFRSPGLFHLALVYPRRKDLAAILNRLNLHRWPFQGFADHGVSEALYLADPDGNGIELSIDRPRAKWPYRNGQLEMVTEPMNPEDLLSELNGPAQNELTSPQGVSLGHIHLQVSSLRTAEEFYHKVLGFDVTQSNFPGALFLSAGGYHHHLGLNVWNSHGMSPSAPRSRGLTRFGIHLGDKQALRSLAERLRSTPFWVKDAIDGFVVHDGDNIHIDIT
jgi:catechol 2,3-dioxygenase